MVSSEFYEAQILPPVRANGLLSLLGSIRSVLTDQSGCNDPHCVFWRLALGVERLEDVIGEGEGDDGVTGRHDDEEGGPEVEKGEEGSEGVLDVGVVSPRLGDHRPQLGVAESPDEAEEAGQEPDEAGEAHGAGVLEDALGADEDPTADDDANDDTGAIR